jgi:ribosomal peptide maturation radical SAM protein 1
MPDAACPALGTLAPILEAAEIETDTLHGTQLFPHTTFNQHFLCTYSAHLFVPYLYADAAAEEVLDELLQRFLGDLSLGGINAPEGGLSFEAFGLDQSALRRSLGALIESAGVNVDRCAQHAAGGDYDIVGFSVTFENQMTASLAIARRLARLVPDLKIIFGGSACFPELATELLASFPAIDVICHSEGDEVIVPLVRALRGEIPLTLVPGIVYREPGGGAVRFQRAPPPLRDLDALPIPDFSAFVEQLEASEWSDLRPRLYFETSRGCWWGEKRHCAFCGLNAETMAFRRKSPERALEEIRTLYTQYPTARRLECTDNILDVGYLETLMPLLAEIEREPSRPLRVFYEVKTNLGRAALQAMSDAGIDYVQPGIESFSDGVLKLMDKGSSGLGQIEFLKWATECGFYLAYNILLRSPGERAEWYETMGKLIPLIAHLPPPINISPIWLERFSPYHSRPEAYGISDLRPRPYYSSLYRDAEPDLNRLAYVFDYDDPTLHDKALLAAHRDFVAVVHAWQKHYVPDTAFYRDTTDGIEVVDRRSGTEETVTLRDEEAALFRFLDRAHNLAAIWGQFPDLERSRVDNLLTAWSQRRWIYAEAASGRFLGVLPRYSTP